MREMGNKIAGKRKDLGMTQMEFAEALSVTRQTVSRWEAGTVLPDIEKIGDIASILGVSCDYLLKDEVEAEQGKAESHHLSSLLAAAQGKKVKLNFFEDEGDIDLWDQVCTIEGFEGNWMKVSAQTKKGRLDKIVPLSSVFSIELMKEEE